MQEQRVTLTGWRHTTHLIRRFFAHVTKPGLHPDEQQLVHDRLSSGGAALFWSQDAADQRHAFEVADRVATVLPNRDDAFVAALLHDVGKRHSGLGAIRRSAATVLDAARMPMTAPMRQYRRHGELAAEELTAAGFDGIVVAFAAHHPGPAPPGVDETAWSALLEADG